MLDTGTTTSYLARELRKRRDLTVVTNSSDIARTLATVNGNTVYMAGGELRGDNGAAFGHAAIDFVTRFQVRHAIISIGAMDAETGADGLQSGRGRVRQGDGFARNVGHDRLRLLEVRASGAGQGVRF